jgi:lipid-A-disaccharide synthase
VVVGEPTAVRLALVAGEASGDLHAANLLVALRGIASDIQAFGVGGERLRAAGFECIARSEELSVMGLAEVVRHLPRLWRLSRYVRRELTARRPDVAVLVDSPDFNLPLARALRAEGIPVVYYVSPQLWAWRQGRVRRIRRDVLRVLCILPFEVPFYESHGVPAEYVGHPLVDELHEVMAAPPTRQARLLGLLPGSRWHEIDALLPTMLEAVGRLATEFVGLGARLIAAPGVDRQRLSRLLASCRVPIEIVAERRHERLAECDAALVASGTATLECALLDVPMVVCYRLHAASFFLAKRLVRVPHVALVNVVAGRGIVPEAVQDAFTAGDLVGEVGRLLGGGGDAQREDLSSVRRALGEPGASVRAARAVMTVTERAR